MCPGDSLTTAPASAFDHATDPMPIRWTLARQILAACLVLPTVLLAALFGPGLFTFPPVAVFLAIQLVCAALLVWRGYKWAALVGGIAVFGLAAMNMPFLATEMLRPDHGTTFIAANAIPLIGAVGLGAGIAAFREGRRNAFLKARWGAPGAAAVLVAAGIVLGVAFAGLATMRLPSPGAGAVLLTPDAVVEVRTADFTFAPATITIPAEKIVKLVLTNEDAELHTFTIAGLNFHVDILPGKTVEAWIQAPAGTYQVYCKPHSGTTAEGSHEGMVGQLVVE